jgi:protein-histidine pros-kinase
VSTLISRLFDPSGAGLDVAETLASVAAIIQSATEHTLVAVDLAGRIVLWNEGARSMYGYEAKEALEKLRWDNLFSAAEIAATRPGKIRARALRDNRWQGLIGQVGKDARPFQVQATVTPWRNAEQTVLGLVFIAQHRVEPLDTDRAEKRQEREREEREERFEGILESAPDGVVLVDERGQIAFVNSQTETMFGLGREKLLGRPVEMLLPDSFRERHPAQRSAYFQDPGIRPKGESRIVSGLRQDGSSFPVEVTLSPFTCGDERYAIGSIRDITQRRKLEERIRSSHERFRLLVEGVRDYAIYMLDVDGNVLSWNVGAERIKGYGADEIIGQHFSVFYPQEARERGWPTEELTRATVEGQFEDEGWRVRKDGSQFWANVVITAIRDEAGRLQGFSKVTRDLTERTRHERALHEKNLELERANQAKNRFLATMSHELRTPLNAIIGFTGTLLMKLPGPLTGDQEKQLRIVQNSARHLLSLINDLLDLAKIESGKAEVNNDPIVCQAVLQGVVAALRPLAEAKGLRFEVRVPPHDLIIRSDRRVLSQILLNLANNAIKFTDIGGINIELLSSEVGGRKRTEFRVSDTGIGIREEDRTKLFQAFKQVDQVGNSRREGTGLGLHLSQKMATVLGGTITFQSEFGHGSTFSLVLEEV